VDVNYSQKIKILLVSLALVFFFQFISTAELKDTKNYLSRIVLIKGDSAIGVGFVLNFKGRKYVVSGMDTVYDTSVMYRK